MSEFAHTLLFDSMRTGMYIISPILVRIIHTHSILHPILSTIYISFIMQNEYFSDSLSRESDHSQSHNDQALNVGFTITPQDSGILQEYLEEFQAADTDVRTRIVEKVMAELYLLRPANTPFDKKEASKVCCISMNQCICTLWYDLENTEMVL